MDLTAMSSMCVLETTANKNIKTQYNSMELYIWSRYVNVFDNIYMTI